jgi:hypothetical protein
MPWGITASLTLWAGRALEMAGLMLEAHEF